MLIMRLSNAFIEVIYEHSTIDKICYCPVVSLLSQIEVALKIHFLSALTRFFFKLIYFVYAAFKRLSQLEGIIPALETSHALAYLEQLCPTLPNGTKVVLNCSGRGDKDVQTAIKHLQI